MRLAAMFAGHTPHRRLHLHHRYRAGLAPDTYMVSEMRAPARGGGAEAERAVLAETDAFCRRQNKVFLAIDLRPDGDPSTPYYPTAFDATFRCVSASP